MKRSFLLLFILLSSTRLVLSQTCDNTNGTIVLSSSPSANTYIFTSKTTSQAYYWSVAGAASISGSNTSQTVTVIATGSFQINLVTFKNGQCINYCYPFIAACNNLHIEATVEMCNATGVTGRGHYTYWCGTTESPNLGFPIEWKILEDPNHTTFLAPLYTNSIFLPSPKINLPGNPSYTIQLFRQGTSILLASYSVTIHSCNTNFSGKKPIVSKKTNIKSGEQLQLVNESSDNVKKV